MLSTLLLVVRSYTYTVHINDDWVQVASICLQAKHIDTNTVGLNWSSFLMISLESSFEMKIRIWRWMQGNFFRNSLQILMSLESRQRWTFRHKKDPQVPKIELKGHELEYRNVAQYLDPKIDENLNFRGNLRDQKSRIEARTNVIKRISGTKWGVY